jgi:hypothetical protein
VTYDPSNYPLVSNKALIQQLPSKWAEKRSHESYVNSFAFCFLEYQLIVRLRAIVDKTLTIVIN